MPESSSSESAPSGPCENRRFKMEPIKESLCVDDMEWGEIEAETREQSRNMEVWNKHRLPRLTTSMCKRADIGSTTSPTKAIRDILQYNEYNPTKYMIGGLVGEHQIIKMYMEEIGNTVQKCGFFVSTESLYLGATPNGIIGSDGYLECKIINMKDESLKDALVRKGAGE